MKASRVGLACIRWAAAGGYGYPSPYSQNSRYRGGSG
jgi:hypothetical protein